MGNTHTPAYIDTRRPSTGNKVNQAQKTYLKLLRRVKKEGETKWLQNALILAEGRLVKFGFNPKDFSSKS
ncbi:MAG: hypothetical protein A2788_01695 [Candidatus Abawacabacteria bacterium RIFCSPHIGHO2_01_FULL_46_8]|uniref:Transposase n=1 Tax=Candidatus Abawacabacteria bacterium RIFCSPHIGHO2_01_FULL_46_8 TaxID=1817815 RepID=A0A1F4XL98_9BACT|nr:MAG: hypothetical protein A2788_01695 [Candidatus Abawacabacteria bacterium RIFCSPHIGHO2_01_FULL_46_8]